jgi:DNA-binding NtrC family response regulator
MRRPRILVVDSDPGVCAELRLDLGERGFDVGEAPVVDEALLAIPSFSPDAVLVRVDARSDGAALLAGLREQGSDAAVVAVARSDALEPAVAAMRAGAESYLVAPVTGPQAAIVLEKALEKRRLRRDTASLREQVRRRHAIVGSSPELQLVQEVIRRAAPTKATVLVLGETGTGRELVAQAVHETSPRRDRPFVRVSCAAVSETLLESELFGHEKGAFADATHRREGRFEAADGGTLFLHEVAHLSPALQVKLLRVLQQAEFERVGGRETLRADVRVIAASTRDLAEEVRAGRFRDDLYYRLNVVAVQLPPLRERKGDIPALVEYFLHLASRDQGKDVRTVSPGALSALFAYDWPGNVRELAATVERAVEACNGTEIGADELPPVLHGARAEDRTTSALIPGATLFEIEREAILRTLEEVGGSTARAAEVLGISVRKIQYRLKEYRSGHLNRRGRAPTAQLSKVAVV